MLSWRGPKHPHYGGAEINTLENVTAWVKDGNKVVWFTSIFPGGLPSEVINGVEIVRIGSQNFEVHIAAFWWYLFGHHAKFDIVVDQFHGIPFFTPLYVRVPKLAFIHEVAHEVWQLNPWPRPLNLIPSLFGSLFEPIIFYFYRNIHFMTVSNSTKTDLVEYGIPAKNISVFLSGVNLSLPSPLPAKTKTPTIMFLGALSKDKGIEDAIVTFSLIYKARPSWKFLIVGVGESEYLKKLQKNCFRLGIENQTKFVGFCAPFKKFKLLSSAHILVNPSIREGWGLVNIEANAVGTPVVGYEVPGTRDSVRHNITGILVPAHNTESMADKVIQLVENQKKYKQLSKNSITWSKQFSWDKFTKQSLSLLKKQLIFPRSATL